MPWGTIASIAAPAIGGLFGRKSKRRAAERARAQSLEDQRMQFSRIRESAEKAGFNPLTALGSTAAGNFGGLPSGIIPPLASSQLAQNAILGVADIATGKAASDKRRREVQDRIAELDLERLEAGQAGAIAALTKQADNVRNTSPRIGAGAPLGLDGNENAPTVSVRPQMRLAENALDQHGVTRGFGPGGKRIEINAQVARQMDLPEGFVLTAEQMAELSGELAGEIAGIGSLPNATQNIFSKGSSFNRPGWDGEFLPGNTRDYVPSLDPGEMQRNQREIEQYLNNVN